MRLTGGRLRGRPVAAPAGLSVRPTADRVREALFNRLVHGGGVLGDGDHVRGQTVLDAFCGTGALGFEALSRGAAQVWALELDRAVAAGAAATAASLGLDDRWAVRVGSALTPPSAPGAPASLGFFDPPYNQDSAGAAITALRAAGWLAWGSLCVIEHDHRHPPALPAGASLLDTRRYGRVAVTITC